MSPSSRKRRNKKGVRKPSGVIGRAEQMEEKLRQDYALGREAEAAEVSARQFAESHGLSVHTVHKLKAFARGYTVKELEQLCKLRRKTNGLPLHWGYVGYLLTVKSAASAMKKDRKKPAKKSRNKERWEFAKLAAEKGWTAPQLYAAIRQKYGWKQGHGRPMVLPDDVNTAVLKVISEGRAWLRRWELLREKLPAVKRRSKIVQRELEALWSRVLAMAEQWNESPREQRKRK